MLKTSNQKNRNNNSTKTGSDFKNVTKINIIYNDAKFTSIDKNPGVGRSTKIHVVIQYRIPGQNSHHLGRNNMVHQTSI